MIYRITGSLFLLSFLSGCVDLSPYQQAPAPVEGNSPSVYGQVPAAQVKRAGTAKITPCGEIYEEKRAAVVDPVVLAFVNESKTIEQRGDISAAVSTLERGVRIRPRDPLLWSRLAELRLQQKKPVLAENLARKSLALIKSGTNRLMQSRNWLVIADALKQQGKIKEANLASQKAKMLQ
jgi:tetratricopeptide (TPR) repeat protein